MKLFECIDGLMIGARYLTWMIALFGIAGSVVLLILNLSLGLASAAVFLAAFFLSVAVTLLLMPKKLSEGKIGTSRRNKLGCIALVIAAVIMAIVYFSCGGFPVLNLIFI